METNRTIFNLAQLSRRWASCRETLRIDCEAGRVPGAFKTPRGYWRIPLSSIVAIENKLVEVPTPEKKRAAPKKPPMKYVFKHLRPGGK